MVSPSQSELQHEWYSLVSAQEPFQQGDFFARFPIVIPTAKILDGTKDITLPIEYHDVVLMTHSCDFEGIQDDDLVIFCDRWDFGSFANKKNLSDGKKKSLWGALRKGQYIKLHLLNKSDIYGHEFDYQIIVLDSIFYVPFIVLKTFTSQGGPRTRLLSPYREHLAQAFARQFMRVGLPSVLPENLPDNFIQI